MRKFFTPLRQLIEITSHWTSGVTVKRLNTGELETIQILRCLDNGEIYHYQDVGRYFLLYDSKPKMRLIKIPSYVEFTSVRYIDLAIIMVSVHFTMHLHIFHYTYSVAPIPITHVGIRNTNTYVR